jgi:hypothetical protein
MNIIQLLFELLRKFVPFQQGEYAKLKDEAESWYEGIREDDEELQKKIKSGDKKAQLMIKFKQLASSWQARTLGAVLYIVLVRKIYEWMESPLERPEEEEERGMFN